MGREGDAAAGAWAGGEIGAASGVPTGGAAGTVPVGFRLSSRFAI